MNTKEDKSKATDKPFDDYVKNARDEFTLFINAFEWRADLRTHIESLLICFDQMRERLTPSTDSKEAIDFSEWCNDNYYRHSSGLWFHKNIVKDEINASDLLNTADLHKIFNNKSDE